MNGHGYVKRQLVRRGIGFEALDNAGADCDDPEALQAIASCACRCPTDGRADRRTKLSRPGPPAWPVPAQACRRIEHTFRYAWFRVWPGRDQMFADGCDLEVDRMLTQGHELRAEVRETAEQ